MANIKTVVAIEPGHDGRVYRQAGERFSVDVDDPRFKDSTWFAEPEKVPPPKAKPKEARPPGAGPAKGSAVKEEAAPGAPNAGDPEPTPAADTGTF